MTGPALRRMALALAVLGAVAADGRSVRAEAEAEEDDEPAGDGSRPLGWTDYAPAGVDVSQIRNVEPRTRLYLDAGYARSGDLSALPYVDGSGHNFRAALGGSLRLARFQFDAELPSRQLTTLDVTQIPGGMPLPEDAHQTEGSFGDLRLGAQWTDQPFADTAFLVGFGLRGRFPTHTVRFKFHLVDGSIGTYAFPYYFHVEPTILLGGALGPLSFVVNQGPVVLLGPDADFEEIHFVVPTLYFWDSHLAAVLTPHEGIGLSLELNTIWQLSHVDGVDFRKINNVRAWSLVPGIQVHIGAYRIDAVGRIGLSQGADLVGVIGYGGTNSVTVRVSRFFD